jgi:hypothetical protein
MLAGAEDFIPHNSYSLQGPQTPKITQILSNPFAQLIKNILNMFYNKNVSIGRNVSSLKTRLDQLHKVIVKPARSFTMDATRSVLFGGTPLSLAMTMRMTMILIRDSFPTMFTSHIKAAFVQVHSLSPNVAAEGTMRIHLLSFCFP